MESLEQYRMAIDMLQLHLGKTFEQACEELGVEANPAGSLDYQNHAYNPVQQSTVDF